MEPRIIRITLSDAEQSRWSLCLLLALLVCVLSSCQSTAPPLPPPIKPLEDAGLAVRFQPASAPDTQPQLVLAYANTGTVLATETSLFTPEVIEAVGAPTGTRLVTHMSVSGNTLAVWEDATGSSPERQIVLFVRQSDPDGMESWRARRVHPPSQPARLRRAYANPVSVDDEFLYFAFDDWPMEKERLSALKPVLPGEIAQKPRVEKRASEAEPEPPQSDESAPPT